MIRSTILVGLVGFFMLSGCPKRDQVPETAYDPELIETARAIREQQEAEREAYEQIKEEAQRKQNAECGREIGGCEQGYLCWDSWYCKQGFSDQCTASGDKRCHKKCTDRRDCPKEMPICRETPIFNGSDHGVLEKICVESLE